MNLVGCRQGRDARETMRWAGADGQTVRSIEYVRTRVGFACINQASNHVKAITPAYLCMVAEQQQRPARRKEFPPFKSKKIDNDSSVSVHRYLAIYLGTTCSQRISLRRSDGPPRDRGLHRSRWRECPDINFLLRWDGEWIIVAWLILWCAG